MQRLSMMVGAGAALVALFLAAWAPGAAQGVQRAPGIASTVFTGYGTANYFGTRGDTYAHDFSASISPVLLFGIGEDILFEAEFEFGLEGGETTTALEYAQIDYLAFDRVQFTMGKFLLPFGVFGERLHPSWINKMPTAPSLYGHAHGGVAEGALLPILSDVGGMARVNLPLGGRRSLNLSFYVTQGPEAVSAADGEDAHSVAPALEARLDPQHDDEPPTSSPLGIPTVAFGANTSDNNQNKMLGARLGLLATANLELYVSGFHAMYDEEDYLDYKGGAVSVDWRTGPLDVKAEAVLLRQEFVRPEIGAYATLERTGYYLQGARRFGAWEPVVRWGQLLDGEVQDPDGNLVDEDAIPGIDELAFGINYWVSASVPIKLAYAWNRDDDDRVLLQWAFGF